jgi:excisionase family DNA binding protein
MTAPLQELLKPQEAADALRVSVHTIYRKVASGELRALRLGEGERAPIRIDAADLARFPRDRSSEAV